MDVLEFQDECSLISFPFRDGSSLTWTDNQSNSGTFPNTIILDAVYTTAPPASPTPIGLIGISFQSIISGVTQWKFEFVGNYNINVEVNLNGTETGIVTYSGASNDSIKAYISVDIDVGEFNTYMSQFSLPTHLYQLDFDGYTPNNLCLTCYRILPPGVIQITLDNTTLAGSTQIYQTNSEQDTLALYEGANIDFAPTGNNVLLSVTRGAGEGLYNGCVLPGNQITTINGVGATTEGNFLLNTDYCYSADAGTGGLYIANSCQPECTAQDITNMADYYNRVSNLANQLSVYLVTSQTQYINLLDDYYNLETVKMDAQNPYVQAVCNSLSNAISQFHNVSIGLYSPSLTQVDAELSITYDTTALTYQPASGFVTQNGVNTKLADPVFSENTAEMFNRNLSCNSVMYAGFTVYQPLNTPIEDVTINMTSPGNGNSGYILPLNPTVFDFSVQYQVDVTSVRKVVTLNLTFVDITQPIAITSLNTAITGSYQFVSNQLFINNAQTILTSSSFENQTVDFSQSNSMQLIISYLLSDVSSPTITFTGVSATGSVSKTVTLNLAI